MTKQLVNQLGFNQDKNVYLPTSCITATITHDYTFLEVNVEPRLDAGIGITVSLLLIFNPRCACEARVGRLVRKFVCLSVCYHVFCHHAQRDNKRAVSKVWWLFGADHFLSVCLSVSLCDVICHHAHAQFAEVCTLIYDLFISW